MTKVIISSVTYGKCNLWQVLLMASVTYGKRIMASVIMAKVFMAKVLWQMKLSHLYLKGAILSAFVEW